VPVYRVKTESGPDHHKRFLVEVRLKSEAGQKGKPLARGMGRTKKHAEQDAARRALSLLAKADASHSGADPSRGPRIPGADIAAVSGKESQRAQ
jgi:ribonuclease-3